MARTRKGTIEVTFRGMDGVTVHYEDGGYEPDVNAYNFDWWFDVESLNKERVTNEEEGEILEAIEDALNDDGYRD